MERKTIFDFFAENPTKKVELMEGTFSKAEEKGMVCLTLRFGKKLISDDESDFEKFYEEQTGSEFRVCQVCGIPFDAGYINADQSEYVCQEHFRQYMDERYGQGKWKENEEVGCFEDDYYYLTQNDDETWEGVDVFYTEWW